MSSAIKPNGRIDAISVAKGIGMLFVIFAHINYTDAPLTVIYSFHMPLFFILSGVVFQREKYPDFKIFIKAKFKSLIIPYLIFQAISVAFFVASQLVFSGFSYEMLAEAKGYILQVFISQGSAGMYNRPMWFVLCLLTVEILYYFISSLNKITVAIICTALTAVGWILESGLLPINNQSLPWSIDSALFALGFYALGNLLSTQIKSALEKAKSAKYKLPICAAVAVICLAAGIPLALFNGKVSLGSKDLENGFLLYLTGIIGTVFILALSIIFEKSRLLKFCGMTSFYIMSTHYIIRDVLTKVYLMLGIEVYDRNVVKECIVPVIIITVASIIAALVCDFVFKKLGITAHKPKKA